MTFSKARTEQRLSKTSSKAISFASFKRARTLSHWNAFTRSETSFKYFKRYDQISIGSMQRKRKVYELIKMPSPTHQREERGPKQSMTRIQSPILQGDKRGSKQSRTIRHTTVIQKRTKRTWSSPRGDWMGPPGSLLTLA